MLTLAMPRPLPPSLFQQLPSFERVSPRLPAGVLKAGLRSQENRPPSPARYQNPRPGLKHTASAQLQKLPHGIQNHGRDISHQLF